MGKRLNDTNAVVAMAPYESQSEHYSKTVRKIDNGYLTTEYKHGPNCPDGPTSKEVFTHHHPDAMDGGMGMNGDAMKRAVDFMKNK